MSALIAINPFEVARGSEAEAVRLWDRVNEFMSRQPGFISARLYRAIDPAARFGLVTVAEWETAESFISALGSDGLATAAKGLDAFAHYPGLYEVIRTA